MIWFTADTHFGHKNVLQHDNRPFKDWVDHDESLIERWNAKVAPGDTVYHLGDFAYRNERPFKYYMDALKGKIVLVRGNHDDKLAWKYEDPRLTKVEALYLRHEGERIYMLHYPCQSWRNSQHGSWHLHGHAHGHAPLPRSNRLDVGCMLWGYAPISFPEVKAVLDGRGFKVFVDQHYMDTEIDD